MIYDIICIGYGIATMSFLLHLSRNTNKNINVLVFDELFDGGDLRRNYRNIHSNTTWSQFLEAVQPFCSSSEGLFESLRDLRDPNSTTTLEEIVYNFQKVLKSVLLTSTININYKAVKIDYAVFETTGNVWNCKSDSSIDEKGRILIVCPGADPKSLHYPKPTLQLSHVLNENISMCRPGNHVLVFGTAHSGTLAIKKLCDQALKVTAIYHGSKPFKFARDGEYDGVKQESAIIADQIINNIPPYNINLIPFNDENAVTEALNDCDWVLYACGFVIKKNFKLYHFDTSNTIDMSKYNPTTGKISPYLPVFGYGIAFPNSNNIDGKTYYDVSLPAFMKHIEKNIDLVVKLL
jgi:hypothetical protein